MKNFNKRFSSVERNNLKINQKINATSKKFSAAMAEQKFSLAKKCCEEALRIMPSNMTLLSDYALSLMRNEEYQRAYKVYKRIYNSADRDNASESWLDGLAEVCGWLNRTEELAKYGNEALQRADKQYGAADSTHFPTLKSFDCSDPKKNIISFSLFGGNPRYCETLVKNIEVANSLFPSWTYRVYLDKSVPQHVWYRLYQQKVQLVDMSEEKIIPPTLWRFLVVDDPSIDRFLIRDADALLSEREQAAVNEWLNSSYHFHHMRDYFTHTELLLAGMWGGTSGVIAGIEEKIRRFMSDYKGSSRFADQNFLKTILWPTIRKSILNHDELFRFHNARAWPKHIDVRWKNAEFHVGSNAGYQTLTGPSILENGYKNPITLIINDIRYTYNAQVKEGKWFINMPFFILDDLLAGKVEVISA